uniref:Uncharacterized protein n=1 Tax=Eptatretus burgeri TaxID=7764 RepID=A0A8C4QS52_EPTBU
MEPDGRVDEGGEAGEPTTKVTEGGHGMVADEVSFDLFDEVLVEASTARQHAYDEVLHKLEGMQRQLQEYKDQASQLESSSSTLQFENSQLKLNISALYKTAKAEIRRKDAEIRMLNSRLASLTYFGREHQKVTTRYSSLPSTCQRSPRLSCQHLVNEQDAQDYHSIQGFSVESFVSLPGNNSLTTSQMSLPPSHLSSKELCTINKNESQEKDIEDSQRVPIASLTPRQVTISTSDDFGKVSLQTPNNKCISKRQDELCFNTLEYQSGSSLKSLAVEQPASASTTTEEHRDSLDLEQKMLMRVNGMHETCPSDGTNDLPNRLQALSLNHDGGTLASQCQTASGVGRMKENWNKVSKTKDADTFLDFNTRNISRINMGEKRKRYFKNGGNIGGMMIKSKQEQNRDVEIICDGGRERKEKNRRDVQKCRETSCVSKWKSATKRCRDSERESESTGGDVCKRTKGSSTLNSRDKPRWSPTLNTTNKAVESSTLSRDKIKEHSTFSKVDKTKESSILIIKEKAKENTTLSSSVEAKESSTSSSRDKVREGSTSSSRDKVRESSTSSSRDNARDNSTSSSRDNVRESSTSIRRDKVRERSTSSSRDKARESSTSIRRDKARESSISSSRDKVRESSTSISRDKARESLTSSSRDKVRESSTSSRGDIARESSNLSSNDKANYSTTLCSRTKATEIASLYFKNKMEETAALDARCIIKKGLTSDSGGTVEQGPTSGAGEMAEEGPTSGAGETAEESPTSSTGETAEEGPTSCVGETAEEGPTSGAGEAAEEGPTLGTGETAEEGPTSCAEETAEEGPTSCTGETAEEGPTLGARETAKEGPTSGARETAEEGLTSCARETAEEGPASGAGETAEEGLMSGAGETAEEGQTSGTRETAGETAEEFLTFGAGETAEVGLTLGTKETAEDGPILAAGETAEEGPISSAGETAEVGITSGAKETAEEGPTSGARVTAEEGPTSGGGEMVEGSANENQQIQADEGKFMPHVSIVGMNSDTCVLESQNRNNNKGEDDEQNDSLAGSAGQFVTCLIEMQATTINSSNSCTQGSSLANPPKDELSSIKAKLEQDEGCIIVSNDKQTTMDVEDGGKGDNCNWKIGITSIGMEDGIASGKGHSAMAEKAFMGSEKVIAESPIVGQCNIVQLLDENKVVEINLTNPKMDFMTSLSLTVSPLKQKEKHLSTILASSAKPQGLMPSGGGHKCGGQELRKMTTGNCGSEMTAGLEHEKRNLFEKSDFYDNGKKVDKNHLNNTPSCQLPSVSENVQNNSNMHCQNDILERNETSDIEEGELVSDSEEEFSLFVQSKCIVNTLSSQNKNRNGTSSKQHLWVVNHQDKMKENQSFDHYRTGSEASHYTKKKEHLRSSQNSKHLQENASCWSSPVEAPCRSMSRSSAPRRSVPFEEPWRSVPFKAPRRPAPVEATRQHVRLAAPRRVALRSARDEGPQRLTSLGLEPFTCLDVIDNHGDGSLAKISEIYNDQVQTKNHASKKQYDDNRQQAGGFSTTVMSALQAARDVVQRHYSKLRKQFECERFWGILRLASREFPTNLEILDWRSHEALRCQILTLIQQTVGNLKKSKCIEQVLQDKPCDMKVLLFKIIQKELDSMFNIVQNLLLSVCPSGHAAKQIQEQRTRQLRVSFVNDESAEGPLPQQSFCIDNGACDNSKKKLTVLPAESVRNNPANEPNDVLRICYDKGFGDMNTYRIPKLSKKELPEMSCQNACRPLAKKHNKPPMEKSKRHSEVASSKLNVSTDEQQWKQKELLPKGPEMQFKPMIGSSEQHSNNLVPTSVTMVDYTVDMDSCDSLLAQRLWDTGDIEIDGCPATPGKSMFGPTSSEIKNTPASVESVSFSIFPEQVMGEAFKALVRATESQQQAIKPVLAHPFGNARCVGSVSKIRGCAESFLRSEQGRLPIISTILQADLELSHSLLSPLKDSLLFEPSHDSKCNNTSGAGLTKVLPEACFNENAQFEPDMITEDMSPIKDVVSLKEAEIPEGTDKRTDVNRQNGLTTNNPAQSQDAEMMRKCTKEPFGTLDLQQVIGSCMAKSKKVTSDNQQAFAFRRSKVCLMDHCGSEDFLTVETKTENDSVTAENVKVTSECVIKPSLTRQKGATLKTMEGGTGDDRLSDSIMLNNHINSLQTKSPSPHSALPSPSTTIEESNFTPCPATVEATVVQTRSPNMSTMVHRSKRSASVADHECSGVQNCSLCTKMTANRCKIPKGIPQFLSHQDRDQHKTLGSYDGEKNATPSKVLPANNVVIENGERLVKWTR